MIKRLINCHSNYAILRFRLDGLTIKRNRKVTLTRDQAERGNLSTYIGC